MLATWNPFANRAIARASSPVNVDNSLSSLLFSDVAGWTALAVSKPPADVLETDSEFLVSVDLPGHEPARLQLTVENDSLTIQSERKQPAELDRAMSFHSERSCGTFTRSFSLPRMVDAAKCEAKFEHGVLMIRLPKREEARPRSVQIKVSS